jgi:peroxiredoxin
MREVRARFSKAEVAAYAVSTFDSEESIAQWIADTALRVPVVVDTAEDLSCWEMPEQGLNLYTHFLNRTVSDSPLGPFPLQFILAPDHSLAYVSREHRPDEVLTVLEGLVDAAGDSDHPAAEEASP